MEIGKHPVWSNIQPFKKPAHLLRFFLAGKWANLYPRSTFIGITGSVGKTSTKEACLCVLSQKYCTIASRENIDPIFNIPETILKTRPKIKKVILEMGIEHPGEMDFYLSMVKPAVGIVTRVFFSHSQFLGNVEGVLSEKGILIRQLPREGFAILNWDDIHTRKLAKETEAQVIFYGFDEKNCDVWASNIRMENGQTRFELNYGVERVDVTYQLLGSHMVYSALAASALGISCRMTLTSIKKGLEEVEASPHRLQLLDGLNGYNVLDDTYNSSPVAVEEALNVLNGLPARRRIVVLGEMRELGIYSESLHRDVARKLYKDRVDLVVLGGGEAHFIADELIKLGFPSEKMEANLSNSQIVSQILKAAGKGDMVLIKGSRAVRLEEVVKRITRQKKK